MSGREWTVKEIEIMAQMFANGSDIKTVAAALSRPYHSVKGKWLRLHQEPVLGKDESLCWHCKNTNRFKCTWFDPDAPVMPEGCDDTAKDVIYTGGNNKTKQVRRKVTLYTIKKCPNFEREAPRYEATGNIK